MTEQVYYFKLPDGTVRRRIYNPKSEVPIEEALTQNLPAGTEGPFTLSPAQLPQDREYREAWRWDGGKVVEDVEAAKSIHLDKLREKRKEKLAALDVEFMIASDDGDAQALKRIAKKRKRLRDLTKEPMNHINDITTLKQHRPGGIDD